MDAFRSVIINYLERAIIEEGVGIAYIYCSYRQQNQTAGNLVASLLKQLIQQRPASIPSNIRDLYRHHRGRQTHPPLSEYSRLLQAELRHFSKVFIVIDALDECSEESRIREHFLAEVWKLLPQVRLLVTSRHIPDIKRKFKGGARLEIRASDEDIKRYLESRIESQNPLAGYVKMDPTLRSDILTAIIERAHGM
jgi:ankyrin repeat domain-containing protein 50